MLRLLEHAGSEKAHSARHWWAFNCRQTSLETCPLCLSLHMTDYRGDGIDTAFPRHIHMRVNMIKARVHPHCRCRLESAGMSKDVLTNPYGMRRPRRIPEVPKRVAGRPVEDVLSKSQRRERKQIVKYARETWRKKNEISF